MGRVTKVGQMQTCVWKLVVLRGAWGLELADPPKSRRTHGVNAGVKNLTNPLGVATHN